MCPSPAGDQWTLGPGLCQGSSPWVMCPLGLIAGPRQGLRSHPEVNTASTGAFLPSARETETLSRLGRWMALANNHASGHTEEEGSDR